jgi:ABC-type oligopeptide transport system substrate-binding subunit
MHYGGWTALFGDPSIFHNGMLTAQFDRQNHKWKNAKYEDLIARGAAELDPQKRHALYEEAERVVAEEAPVIPWGYKTKPYLIKPNVQGFEVAPNGWVDLFRKVKIGR